MARISFTLGVVRCIAIIRLRAMVFVALLVLAGCTTTPSGPPANGNSASPTAQLPASVNVLPADEATVVAYPSEQFYDPLIGFNRAVFGFNDISYRYVLIPAAKAYRAVTNEPVRTGIGNVFDNIKAPVSTVNHLLQWQPAKAGRTLLRFVVNSTVGIVGIFDPAHSWLQVEAERTAFKHTLRGYGVGQGAYLVLPLLGSADVRSGAALIPDYFLDPVPRLTERPTTTYINLFDTLQEFSGPATSYEALRNKSDDPYLFFRNMYLQGELRDSQYQHIQTGTVSGSDSGTAGQ